MAVRGVVPGLCWALLALAIPVMAQQDDGGNSDLSVPSLPDGSDVRVVVDISGSMKNNDPDNLRRPAVRLLARMLPENARAGVWTFGEYVNNLVAHGAVDPAWRELAIRQSGAINSVALRTNLGAALERAATDYSDGDLSDTHFIVLTDGKVDIAEDDDPANRRERSRILDQTLPRLKDAGATIHTVALSAQADLDLLRQLANETRGRSAVAESADQLSRTFMQALNAAAPRMQVPIRGNRFSIDDGVNEFTALIFSPDHSDSALVLETPGGDRFGAEARPDNMRWAVEPDYDLVTVESPAPGEWTLVGDPGAGSQVTVVSDLRLVVEPLPSSFERGEAVDLLAAFYEEDALLTDPDFLQVIEVTLSVSDQRGRSGSKVLSPDSPPDDGVYRDVIQRLQEPGDYRLQLTADGQTFTRQFSYTLTLREPEQAATDSGQSTIPLIGTGAPAAPGSGGSPSPQSLAEAPAEPAPQAPAESGTEQAAGPADTPPDEAGPGPESDRSLLWLAMAAGGALATTAGGVLLWRRRRGNRAQETASEPSPAEQGADEGDPPVVPEPDPQAEEVVESSGLEPEKAAGEDDDSGEFGLEDFDLADVDELPEDDLDTESDPGQAEPGDRQSASSSGQRPGK